MNGLIHGFPSDGVVTINRVILRPQYTVDDLQERVAMLCENVKTYHSDTGFVGGFGLDRRSGRPESAQGKRGFDRDLLAHVRGP